MRWSLLILLFLAGTAFAKPKIAIAPIDGDKDDEVGEVIVSVAASHGRAIDPGRVGKEMDKLSISKMTSKGAKKLRGKLDADVVVYGKLSKKHLELKIAGKGKSKIEIDFKSNKDLKKQLEKKLGKELDAALEGPDADEDDEEGGSPFGGKDDEDKRKRDEEDDKRKRDEEDKRKREEDDKREQEERRAREDKRKRDEDEERTSKRDKDDEKRGRKRDKDDDDDKRSRKRTARRDEDEEDQDDERRDEEDRPRKKRKKTKRHPLTQAAVWLDVGPAFARRTLTYQATGMMQPPRVGTVAAAAEVSGEIYPASFSTLKGPAAGIGIAGAYDRTLGLGIAVPKTAIVAPITQGFYWIGARYRFVFGTSSVAVGASYWRRYYMADRSKLMMADQLDMPDVDYKAFAPDITARIAAAPNVGVFATVQVPLMFTSGPIEQPMSYGASTILAFDVRAGVQLALGSHYAVQMGLYFDQINLKFVAKQGSMAAARDVTAATDRSIGLAATLGVFY